MIHESEDIRSADFNTTSSAVRNKIDLPSVQRQRDRQEFLDLSNAVTEKDAVIDRLQRWLGYIEENFVDCEYFAKLALNGENAPVCFSQARQ